MKAKYVAYAVFHETSGLDAIDKISRSMRYADYEDDRETVIAHYNQKNGRPDDAPLPVGFSVLRVTMQTDDIPWLKKIAKGIFEWIKPEDR